MTSDRHTWRKGFSSGVHTVRGMLRISGTDSPLASSREGGSDLSPKLQAMF